MPNAPENIDADRLEAAAAFSKADRACTFGPSFFLGHLGRFVRDHCPPAEEHLPMVQVRLGDGHVLDLCHIIGVSPRRVMLAIRDTTAHPTDMAIEFVPFEMIQGISIRSRHGEGASVGFSQSHSPSVLPAETLVEAALSNPVASAV